MFELASAAPNVTACPFVSIAIALVLLLILAE